MDDIKELMVKFRSCLDSCIGDYKSKISDIENQEDFIQLLGDLINYCKSDCMLLPFYDETILARVFERVFPLSNTEINKIKTAKYLVDACVNIDKSNFPQYNTAVLDVKDIFDKLNVYYENLLSDDSLVSNKESFSQIIRRLSSIYDLIGDYKFVGLISDIDCFEQAIDMCKLSDEDVSILLNVAIKSNLEYLDSNGVIIDNIDDELKNESSFIQDEISNLSSLLGDE